MLLSEWKAGHQLDSKWLKMGRKQAVSATVYVFRCDITSVKGGIRLWFFFVLFPATSHPGDFYVRVKYRNMYAAERWVWGSHAGPSLWVFSGASGSPTITTPALPTSRVGQTSSQASWPLKPTSAHENTVCRQESGSPLVHGCFFLPVSCKIRSGSAVKAVIYLCFMAGLCCALMGTSSWRLR